MLCIIQTCTYIQNVGIIGKSSRYCNKNLVAKVCNLVNHLAALFFCSKTFHSHFEQAKYLYFRSSFKCCKCHPEAFPNSCDAPFVWCLQWAVCAGTLKWLGVTGWRESCLWITFLTWAECQSPRRVQQDQLLVCNHVVLPSTKVNERAWWSMEASKEGFGVGSTSPVLALITVFCCL